MNEYDQQLIDRYLAHELNENDRAEVEYRRQSDPVFDAAVREYEFVRQALRMREREKLRQEFAAWDHELDKKKPDQGPRSDRDWRWVWLVMAVLVVGLIWWCISLYPQEQAPAKQEEADSTLPDTTTNPPPRNGADHDDVKQLSPDKERKDNPQKPHRAKSRIQHKELFAAYFEPYKDEMMDPTTRGDTELTALEKFQTAYWDDDYTTAAQLFTTLQSSYQSNDNFRFMYANALLAVGQIREAIPVFENILSHDRFRYRTETYYALALARLGIGDLVKARDLLETYIPLDDARRKEDATRLLHRIK